MKNRTPLYTLIGCAVLIVAAIASCSLLAGCANTTPPTRVERLLFDTVTNYVTVMKTNEVVVPIPVYKTNVLALTVTNEQNLVLVSYSNIITKSFVYETNQVPAPALEAQYALAPKAPIAAVASIGASLPGPWALGFQGALALLAGWGHLRSRAKGTTAATLVDELQVVRTFIQGLPNGVAYDEAVVSFLKDHQAEAGVVTQVVNMMASKIADRDVADAANGIVAYVNSLKSVTTELPPVAPKA